MNKYQINFLFYLEWLYRNYGNTWNINDFPSKISKNTDKIMSVFIDLENKGIIQLLGDDLTFKILKLPSETEYAEYVISKKQR